MTVDRNVVRLAALGAFCLAVAVACGAEPEGPTTEATTEDTHPSGGAPGASGDTHSAWCLRTKPMRPWWTDAAHAPGGPLGTLVPTGEPLAWDSEIDCRMPPMPIARPAACAAGAVYPECKWAMPDTHEVGGLYTRWRNTIDEHTWGRPALVGVMLATAHAFRARFPNQELLVGDLDAPGPRHVTHKTGVDVDLYLPNTLLVENLGARRYRPNYRTMSNVNIEHARHRVEALARILAVCTEGRVRIYYNDITCATASTPGSTRAAW
jgi:hypothetical protein